MKRKIPAMLLPVILFAAACATSVQPCYAYDYKYSNVRTYINEGDRYARQAQSYRNDAERYKREAQRYQRDAESYARRKDYRRADDYQRRADNAIDKMRDYIARAERADANAASAYRRAAITIERR